MKCPQCIENLGTSNYKGFSVRSCLYCDGVWIDKETLLAILASEPGAPALDSITALFKGKRDSARLCPSCGDKMRKNFVRNVELDFCFGCEGIYFDQGELREFAPDARRNESGDSSSAGYTVIDIFLFIVGSIFLS